jgi:hypothetical protein
MLSILFSGKRYHFYFMPKYSAAKITNAMAAHNQMLLLPLGLAMGTASLSMATSAVPPSLSIKATKQSSAVFFCYAIDKA